MSMICFDFLQESVLFDKTSLDAEYENLDLTRIEKELAEYRDYIERNLRSLEDAAAIGDSQQGVMLDARKVGCPSHDTIRQAALYLDAVIADDPLYRLSTPASPLSQEMKEVFGFARASKRPSQREVAVLAKGMKDLAPAVAGGLIRFLPLSRLHAAQGGTPKLKLSTNYFADALPEELLEWFRRRAVVAPLRRTAKGFSWTLGDALTPCREIVVVWEGDPDEAVVYSLTEAITISVDEKTRRVLQKILPPPDQPPESAHFDAWVFQSVNQSARKAFDEVFRELVWSAHLGHCYMTSSPFVADLIKSVFRRDSNAVAHLFKLQLPTIVDASLENVMRVRANEGASFEAFRRELQRRVQRFSDASNDTELEKELREAQLALGETVVNDVKQKMSSLRRSLLADAGAAVAGLVLAVQNQGVSIPLLAATAAHGYRSWNEYQLEKSANPVSFLWQVKKSSRAR